MHIGSTHLMMRRRGAMYPTVYFIWTYALLPLGHPYVNYYDSEESEKDIKT